MSQMGITTPAASRLRARPNAYEPMCDSFYCDDRDCGERQAPNTGKGKIPFKVITLVESVSGKEKFGDVECGNGCGRGCGGS